MPVNAEIGTQAPLALELDHVIIKASHAKQLFDFFTESLGLPVASQFKVIVPDVFSSGSVSVGNLHLECAQVGPGAGFSIPSPGSAAFGGLCMDADRSFGPEELLKRGLSYDILAPCAPDGKPMFTNYKFTALGNADEQFSLTVYRDNFDPIARKRLMRSELESRAGGPLGIVGAEEIIIAATDVETARATWRQLLGEPIAQGQWKLTRDDPTLTVIQRADPARMLALTIMVKSLQTAADFLREHAALELDSEGSLLIKVSQSEGLNIKLVSSE